MYCSLCVQSNIIFIVENPLIFIYRINGYVTQETTIRGI